MSVDRVAGALLIGIPIAFNVFFLALARLFNYPSVLRSPVGLVLSRFLAGGQRLKLVWYGFMLTAVLFVPLAVLLGQVLARDDLQIVSVTTTIGVLAAVVQFLGLARWPFLVPALARAYEGPDASPATRDATAVVFDAFNRYLGVAVGECLGYLLTGAWTVLVGIAMLRSSVFEGWLAWPGIVIGALLALGSFEFVGRFEENGWKLAGTMVPIAYTAWSLWLIVAGVVLLGSAMVTIPLAPIDALRITILMDNVTDPLLFPSAQVERTTWLHQLPRPRMTSAVTDDGLPEALIAEPGFSALVRVTTGGRERTILFDAGVTPTGVVENMRRLELAPKDVEAIVLSHGHWDHVAGMEGIAKDVRRVSLPVLIHPEFWRRRRIAIPGLEPAELPATSRSALEGVGFEIVEEEQPSFLLDGSVLVTGEVDRVTPFETGFLGHEAHVHGSWEPDPLILDDQAIVMRLADRGLVVLTGCGHAGIINVVRHAQRLTGETRVAAVIGGFHLSGPMLEPIIEPTVAAFDDLEPELLMPAHCTGWKAVHRLAGRFPDAFVQSAVGTTISL